MLFIGVIGESICAGKAAEEAFQAGAEIAKAGAVLVCGGLGGVMEESARGAKSCGGTTVGILPGVSRKDANPYIDIPIVTGMGEARNIIVVRSSHAIIAISGSFGTLSEMAYALKLEIPIVGLGTWKLMKDEKWINLDTAESPQQAVSIALEKARARAGW